MVTCMNKPLLLVVGILLAVVATVHAQDGVDSDDSELGTLRPFRVTSQQQLEENIHFAYSILSEQDKTEGGDGMLRPRHFHRFVELALNPTSIAMTDEQAAAVKGHTDAWLKKYGFDQEEAFDQRLPLGLLSRGSPLRWLMATNEKLQPLQRAAGHEEL